MFKISLALLEHQPIVLQGEVPPSFLDMPDTEMIQFKSPVQYDIKANMTVGGIVVQGTVSTRLNCVCGRCLEPFLLTIENEVCHFYEKTEAPELDISEDVREDIILEIPMNPICDDDCQGLCPHCGASLNKKKCRCHENSGGNLAWGELDKLKF